MRTIHTKNSINQNLHNEGRNIELIGEYKNLKTKTQFLCLVDGFIWDAYPTNVVISKTGCKECMKRKFSLTHDEFLSRILHTNFICLDYYANNSTKMIFRCNIDGYEWPATPREIFSGKGCPKCAGNLLKNKNEINEQLHIEKRNILLVGDYINARTVTQFKCLNENCGNQWETVPHAILNGGTGCPKCAGYCFDKSLESILYYIRIGNMEGSFYKIGITNRDLNRRFMKWELDMITPIFERKYESGIDAYNEEQRILKEHSEYLYGGGSKILSSGNSEIFIKDVLGIDYDRKI